MPISPDNWYYSPTHRQIGYVFDATELWGERICRLWLPTANTVTRVLESILLPVSQASIDTVDGISYVAAAARVAHALTEPILLAPLGSTIMVLPHQIHTVARAISGDRTRYLLADEVGLGKTIEAGLIMQELKLRGSVERTLIIAPRGLVMQWLMEMRSRFDEEFHLFNPGDLALYRHVSRKDNLWRHYRQVICSMDSVKPMSGRQGWSRERVAEYNQMHFADLISAGWDLVIVDEAHRLAGTTDQVARHKLGRGLAEAAPHVLLLSATPHQGKTDAFHRLMSLLDTEAFPEESSITQERIKPYVIRTEKRRVIDLHGKPLFTPRRTQRVAARWEGRHQEQRVLYQAVTDYVREGYNQAVKEKRNYLGFLMLLLQRLVVSSTRAIRTTLERRLQVLRNPEEQLSLFPEFNQEEWDDLDSQEQIDTLLKARLAALEDEQAQVRFLVELAARCEQEEPDTKATTLLDWIYRLQAEEGDPHLKLLVFTEFVPTQNMLEEFLSQRGFQVACLNGSMDTEQRQSVQDAFSKDARVLVSTDAGGEGLNFQFCHAVVNYDIPWNPMRLEQRIGRVDRIGQRYMVRALNFVLQDSVERRVQEVLEGKLQVILNEFGVDKTADVLDSVQANRVFDDVYVHAILDPKRLESKVAETATYVRTEVRQAHDTLLVLGSPENPKSTEARKLLSHPLPHWVEGMTVNYVRAFGGNADKHKGRWRLTWPDGKVETGVVFTTGEVGSKRPAGHLTLEDARVRALALQIPPVVAGQRIPVIRVPDIASAIVGLWSLWRVSIWSPQWDRYRIMPLFLADDGRVLTQTAHHIWNQLLTARPDVLRHLPDEVSRQDLERLHGAAEQQGERFYTELIRAHRDRMARERERKEYVFAARRRAIERVGLAQVRAHRLEVLEAERQDAEQEQQRNALTVPELTPLLVVRVEGGNGE